MYKVLVCGGRYYKDSCMIRLMLDNFLYRYGMKCIIHGDASGVDKLAGAWADFRKIDCLIFPADWKKYGRSAGPVRNHEMFDKTRPDIVLAFPGGKGTNDMINYALSQKCKVWKYAFDIDNGPRFIEVKSNG